MPDIPDRSNLKRLFPPKVLHPDEVRGIAPEVGMYKQHFGGHSWPDVKRKYYGRHTDVFTLMDQETLRHIIAGYLDTILLDPGSAAAEFLVYFACCTPFLDFCELLDDDQTDFVLSVIDWLVEDEYFSDEDRGKYADIRKRVKKRNAPKQGR